MAQPNTLRRQIMRIDLEDETQHLESGGRFEVLRHRGVPGKPDKCIMLYRPRTGVKPRPVRALRGVSGAIGRVELSRGREVARRLFDLETTASRQPPRRIAERWLARIAGELGIAADLHDLKFEKVRRTLLGRHVLFQQCVGKTPISGAWVRVDIDDEGRVFNVQNDLVPLRTMSQRKRGARLRSRLAGDEGKVISEGEVRELARKAVHRRAGAHTRVSEPELTYRVSRGEPVLTWKVIVHVSPPSRQWKVYLDAFTGEVKWKRNVLLRAGARARVFDPNPVVALDDTALSQKSPLPKAAYRDVPLRDLEGKGYLDGPYVSTRLTRKRVRRPSGDFRFKRGERGFTEAMVYFHVNRVQRHLQALGFDNVLNRGIPVNVAGQRDDNSFYDPWEKMLSFGTGGVDDAEDAETILHEYGHAIQDAQVPGWGESDESGAMGEGFGDFLAASWFADWKPARLRNGVCSWDSIASRNRGVPFLRRLDSRKKFPRDLVGEVHEDGEIWSACLWELRHALGRPVAERLIIAHHWLLNRWAGFEDAAHALLTTDRRLYGGRNREVIRDVFKRRGILPR